MLKLLEGLNLQPSFLGLFWRESEDSMVTETLGSVWDWDPNPDLGG
jgi:hypothetical protein